MATEAGGGSREKRTVVHGVGQGHGPSGVYESDVEDGFHGGLVEAGKHLPGVGGLHLAGGQNPGEQTHLRNTSNTFAFSLSAQNNNRSYKSVIDQQFCFIIIIAQTRVGARGSCVRSGDLDAEALRSCQTLTFRGILKAWESYFLSSSMVYSLL